MWRFDIPSKEKPQSSQWPQVSTRHCFSGLCHWKENVLEFWSTGWTRENKSLLSSCNSMDLKFFNPGKLSKVFFVQAALAPDNGWMLSVTLIPWSLLLIFFLSFMRDSLTLWTLPLSEQCFPYMTPCPNPEGWCREWGEVFWHLSNMDSIPRCTGKISWISSDLTLLIIFIIWLISIKVYFS